MPDPDADFLPSRIPDPGVKKAPNPGSRIRIPDPDPQHCRIHSGNDKDKIPGYTAGKDKDRSPGYTAKRTRRQKKKVSNKSAPPFLTLGDTERISRKNRGERKKWTHKKVSFLPNWGESRTCV
jgi:hypothetical protein